MHGVAAVAIRESHYAGCLAAHRERATSKGCMILSTCSDPTEASVAPCGGLEAPAPWAERFDVALPAPAHYGRVPASDARNT